MKSVSRAMAFLAMTVLVTACDIEAVSVGEWNIITDTPSGAQPSVWSIAADGEISMVGDTVTAVVADFIEGSRFAWSLELPNPENSAEPLNVNFSGTVDGDRLQGTIFTTLGNFSVSGIRQ